MKTNKYKVAMEALTDPVAEKDPADDKLKAIKKKADHIRAKAELLRAKNQLTLAKLSKGEIKEKLKNLKKNTAKVQTVNPQDEQPPENAPDQTNNDEVDMNSGNPIQEEQPPVENEVDLNSGDPLHNEDVLITDPSMNSINEVEGDDQEQQQEDPEQQNQAEPQPEEQPQNNIVVAGSTPQSKEEAEIARIQAQTREIQARSGELPGAQPQGDPNDPNQMGMDPNAAAMDPMMGGQPQKPDPMKGFGSTTTPVDPNAMMGMGGMGAVDPMTGMPIPDDSAGKSLSALGRTFELKKLFYKLSILDKVLSKMSNPDAEELQKEVSQLFDIFKLVCNNLKSYKDNIDDIIVAYYMFVKKASRELESYLMQKTLEDH